MYLHTYHCTAPCIQVGSRDRGRVSQLANVTCGVVHDAHVPARAIYTWPVCVMSVHGAGAGVYRLSFCMAGRKRERSPELEEFSDVTSLIRASPNAKVHGIVTRLSPMKRGKKSEYFDGELSDGKCKVRLFGFDSVVQKTLAGFQEKGAPVSLEKCAVKSAREGPKFEVLVKNQTVVKPSSTQFDVEVSGSSVGARKEVVKLDEVGGMQEYERVTVVVKAVRVDEPMEVSGGRRKQDVMVSDGEKTMRVTMWEDDIGKLVEGLSYKLAGMMVRSFGPAGKKETYLSTGKQGSTVDEVEDIGAIEEKEGGDGTVRWQLEDVVVVGVPVLDTYLSCLKCSCKVVAKKEMIGLGRCGKCGMLQRLDRCKSQMSAQLLIEVDNTVLTLQAFSRTVIAIAQTDDVTEAALLKAKPFTLRYSEKNVIQSVMRKD